MYAISMAASFALISLLLAGSSLLLYASAASSPEDEQLIDLFKSFVPNGFLEKPISGKAAADGKDSANAEKKTKESLATAQKMLHGLGNVFKGLESPDIGNCVYTCSNNAKPEPKPKFKPKPNGCGTHGFKVDVSDMPGLTQCCNQHDICYGTCNSGQAVCDRRFNACLANACDEMHRSGAIKTDEKLHECRAYGAGFHLAAMSFGCEFYREAQGNACVCGGGGGGHTASGINKATKEKIRQYNKEKRAREAHEPMREDATEGVNFLDPAFDLPEAVDHEEL